MPPNVPLLLTEDSEYMEYQQYLWMGWEREEIIHGEGMGHIFARAGEEETGKIGTRNEGRD